jgi:NADPH:quinone reductase and related Zn-dependent oxidoreductases
MKALLSRVPGGPGSLEYADLPDPTPGPGELLIDVRACAINYPDVLLIADKYQTKLPRPFIPGGEIAGVVAKLGTGVSGWSIGDRVIAIMGQGGLAERISIDAASAVRLPAERGFAEGSALILTYATAIHALVDRGKLSRGDNLLVLGAAGGVGLAAVELGKAFGARVVGAVSSQEKAEVVRAAGADEVIVYPRDSSDAESGRALAQQFKDAVGVAGADVVLDPVGGSYAEAALRAIAWQGRYLVVGFPAGIPKIALNLVLLKSANVCGIFWGAFAERDPERNAANLETLLDLWRSGSISPKVSQSWPLEQGADAIAHMASRQAIGKLVVTIDG